MLNVVVLHGRLTKDVEVQKSQSGISHCQFSIGVERNYKNGDERISDFIECTAFRGTADFIGKYFHKGDGIIVSGSLQQHNWTDKDGNKRYSYNVVVDSADFAEKKQGNQSGSFDDAAPVIDSDLPF